ncbi:MAG: RNA-binding S4 domain-containing protein [Pyrinomonadaceae bacterium]
MRLDLFLKVSRLIVRRSLAQAFCDANKVRVNGMAAKSSKDVKAGDEIEIRRKNRMTKVSVLLVPDKKQMSKAGAETLYKVLSEETFDESNPLA